MKRFTVVIAVIASTLALGTASLTSAASSSTTTSSSVPVYTDDAWVPVITCATSTGINETPSAAATKMRFLKIPSNLMGRVTFYADAFGRVKPLVGPANWDCSAEEGADGTYVLSIESPFGKSGNEFVSASSDGPCAGCVFAVACPWLSTALKHSDQVGVKCRTLPTRERVHVVSQSGDTSRGVFFISDPAGVSGSLTSTPSKQYASEGYVVYNMARSEALTLTCALPSSLADVCHLVEADFISGKWGQT